MKQLKRLLLSLLAAVCLPVAGQTAFVTVKDGHFLKDGKPYYYVGTNFWYGAILGSEGQGGDRRRLGRELDLMKRMGIDNLRILVGSDGERGVTTKVEPTSRSRPTMSVPLLLGTFPMKRLYWNSFLPVSATLEKPTT